MDCLVIGYDSLDDFDLDWDEYLDDLAKDELDLALAVAATSLDCNDFWPPVVLVF